MKVKTPFASGKDQLSQGESPMAEKAICSTVCTSPMKGYWRISRKGIFLNTSAKFPSWKELGSHLGG